MTHISTPDIDAITRMRLPTNTTAAAVSNSYSTPLKNSSPSWDHDLRPITVSIAFQITTEITNRETFAGRRAANRTLTSEICRDGESQHESANQVHRTRGLDF